MGFIHCCGALRRSLTYSLVPSDGYLIAELDVLESCPVCGSYVVQLTRVNLNHEVSALRRSNLKAHKLFANVENSILYLQKYKFSPPKGGRFYLNYNEFGVKKRCYSNLSTLKIGKYHSIDDFRVTNPIKTHSLKPISVPSFQPD